MYVREGESVFFKKVASVHLSCPRPMPFLIYEQLILVDSFFLFKWVMVGRWRWVWEELEEEKGV